jgi:hypothetical protein
LGGESLSFLELPLIELVAPLEGVVVVEGSSVEPVSLGASVDVAVVVEDGKDVEAEVEEVAVDCDLSCDVDGYRVDEEIVVDESGVIKKKRC